MPTYPTPPTLAGDVISSQWLMNNPAVFYRTLRTIVQQRLIGGRVLSGRRDLTGSGVAVFGVAESLFPRKAAQRVAPGAPYPLTVSDDGTPAVAIIDKNGIGEAIPQELIARRQDDVVAKKILKLANQIIFGFDGMVLSAVGSAVTQTQAASAGWSTAGADPFLDTLLSGAKVDELNQGYVVDVILARPMNFARLIASAKVLGALPREADTSAILKGNIVEFAGLTIVKTTNLPVGVDVMVLDSLQLGSIGYERIGGEGWTGDPLDVETKVMPMQGSADGFEIYARKLAVPMVQEPGAAVKVTGV